MGGGPRAPRRGARADPRRARPAVQVRFEREAKEELTDAARWYERDYRGRGTRFELAVERTLAIIAVAPHVFQERRGVRAAPVARFPFVILYDVVDETTVVVVAIAHTSQRPGYWRGHRWDLGLDAVERRGRASP